MKCNDDPNLSGCYLSVVVITYNHEKYLRKCLDSILMQEVDFDFEIIIGDDCSPDSTADIINDYHERYPDIVRPTLRSHNVGATRNQYDCFLQAKGKYIAILDGDDFKLVWINDAAKAANWIGDSSKFKDKTILSLLNEEFFFHNRIYNP